MKKHLILIAAATLILAGCNNDKNNPKDEGPFISEDGLVFAENGAYYLGNGDQNFPAPVRDYVLDASKTYILRGWVYIQDGSTLTIPAGTLIRGCISSDDVKGSSLIIEPGAKIFAQGSSTQPIVFTSGKPAGQRKPGDWGGVIICGRAGNNMGTQQIEGGPRTMHGGGTSPVNNDDSGVLSYVRIEFAGYPFQTNAEINGLTLGSVGSGTKIDHVQVSYSNDDSFEWFGGSVNCKYLVAYHGWDDDFDTDNGFSGKMQFLLGVRHPKIADTSMSNGFESDNNSGASQITPYTTASFCNVTLVGPIGQDANFVNTSGSGQYINAGTLDPGNGSLLGQFQAGMQIRRNSRISVTNSVVTGYPIGLIIEDDKVAGTQANANTNNTIKNLFFVGYTDNAAGTTFSNSAANPTSILGSDCNKNWTDSNGTWDYAANPQSFAVAAGTKSFSHELILKSGNGCQVITLAAAALNNPVSVNSSLGVNPSQNYGPRAGSPLIGSFTVPAGFDTAGNGYAGAFKSDSPADNWLAGWSNFDPQNTVY